MINKIVLFVALISTFSFSQLRAQSRVNATVLQIDSVSKDMLNVKRWRLMPTGKWEDVMPPKFLRWGTFKRKGQNYHIFIYPGISGHYKYPDAKLVWITDYTTRFVVFNQKEYDGILGKLNQKSGKNLYFRSADNGAVLSTENGGGNKDEEDDFLKNLTEVMDQSRILKSNLVFAMNSQKVDGVEVIRFSIPVETQYMPYLLKDDYNEVPFADFIAAMKMTE
jgi:hypothetical protein